MVYGVFDSCYGDCHVVGYFDNRDDAEKYCCISNADYYVEPLKNLTNEKEDKRNLLGQKPVLRYCLIRCLSGR